MLDPASIIDTVGFFSIILENLYIFYIAHLFIALYFTFKIFNKMPNYGFSKESSLDIALLALLTYATIFLATTGNALSLQDISQFFIQQVWFYAILACITFIILACRISGWSYYKVLDIFSGPTLFTLSLSFFVVFVYTSAVFFIVSCLILGMWGYTINKAFDKKFSSFLFFKIEKPDEYSFIGAAFLLTFFVLTVLSIAGLVIYYLFIPLIVVNSLLLVFIVYLLWYRSKKFKVVWNIQKSLYKSKKEHLNKNENLHQQKLID